MADIEKVGVPITLKCPVGGEEWPTECFKAVVDIYVDKLQYRHVRFTCPVFHGFTLRKAVNGGMLTKEQAEKVFRDAKEDVKKFKHDFVHGNWEEIVRSEQE